MKYAYWFFVRFLIYCKFILIGISHCVPLRGQKVRDATQNDALSFAVSIGKVNRTNISHFCTGTLISRWSVLTAEHCLFGKKFADIEITIGSTDLQRGEKYYVSTWKTFDQWYYQTPEVTLTVDDIAIITLTEKVKDTEIKPASILFTQVQYLYHSKVRIAGWGLTENGTVPTILQTAVVKVVSLPDCLNKAKDITGEDYRVPDDYFCSSAEPCALIGCGDSGGPVLNKANQLVAISKGGCPLLTNRPKEFADNNQMNLHLHLLRYRNYINAVKLSD